MKENTSLQLDFRMSYEERSKNHLHLVRPTGENNFDFIGVNIPSTYQQGLIPDDEEPPFGLLRVVVAARELHGFNAGILDAHQWKMKSENIIAQIEKAGTKVVGINPTSVNISEAVSFAKMCDALNLPYIVGGVHATLDPKKAKEDFPGASAIVRGSGEIAIGEILSVIIKKTKPKLPGILYKNDKKDLVLYAPKIDLNTLPFVRQDVYVERPIYLRKIQVNSFCHEIREASIFSTQGCPFSCTFCSSPVMVNRHHSRSYMRPKMSKIMEEISWAIQKLNANAIHFLDDMAFISGKNIIDFYQNIIDYNLQDKFIWRGMIKNTVLLRSDFDEKAMKSMKNSGCWKIAMGIESGNNNILKRIGKGTTTSQIREAVKKLISYDIKVKGFFIIGFPEETVSEIKDTLRFILELKEIGMSEISVFQFKPYPGTVEYQLLLQKNPEVIKSLSYLKRKHDGDRNTKKLVEEHSWLSDEITIAQIPSSETRFYITDILKRFYEK